MVLKTLLEILVTIMNTVDALLNLRSGLMRNITFNRQQATRRITSLRLSTLVEVENAHSSGINTIDMDKTEGR
jgi:hypothetical protein